MDYADALAVRGVAYRSILRTLSDNIVRDPTVISVGHVPWHSRQFGDNRLETAQ